MMKKSKEKVETSVERAPGQKAEAQTEYKDYHIRIWIQGLGHSWHLKSP